MKLIERIHAFDIVRGFAVIFMIILHTGLHEWAGAQELKNRQSYVILFFFGCFVLLLTLPLRWWGAPLVDNLISSKQGRINEKIDRVFNWSYSLTTCGMCNL